MNPVYQLIKVQKELDDIYNQMSFDEMNVKQYQQLERRVKTLEAEQAELNRDIDQGINTYCEECGDVFQADDPGEDGLCRECHEWKDY